MDHPGNRAFCPRLDVGSRAGNCSGGRNAAEQGGADVADALGDKFHVRFVPSARHAVRDGRAQEGFNGRQQGDGKGGRRQRAHVVPLDMGEGWHGQCVRQAAEGLPDGGYGECEGHGNGRHSQHAYQHGRALGPEAAAQQGKNDGSGGQSQRGPVDGVEVLEVTRPFVDEITGNFLCNGEAEDVLDLCGEDHHGNAGGKSRGDGEGDEADERPHAADAEDDEKDARHQGADHKGACGAAYLVLAAAEQGNEEPGHNGGDKPLGRGKPACNGEGHGQRNGYDAHGQPREEV